MSRRKSIAHIPKNIPLYKIAKPFVNIEHACYNGYQYHKLLSINMNCHQYILVYELPLKWLAQEVVAVLYFDYFIIIL